MVTERPRARSRWPRLDAVSPLPREDATPPVTKMCLVVCDDLEKREFVRCTTEFEPITFPAAPGSAAWLPAADRTPSEPLFGSLDQLQGMSAGGFGFFLPGQHAGQFGDPF